MIRAAVKRIQKELATLSEDESVLNLRPVSSSIGKLYKGQTERLTKCIYTLLLFPVRQTSNRSH